ncbi:hypothetical protein GGH94_003335 [Coemansia aciculifera]|uniref:NAD(P)-binding protein n=1 Tax=Coemansia aciculifera TaxID=417176 RepID=A0A9W8M5V3_9FUNG|nr:hypothetical protein GGH94_003335 [Coemansia aciculifera]KAJ2873280.1 hypothetical protein GGH93_003348 [Coemansia aciculifera]
MTIPFDYIGKVAVVTGGAQSIGLLVAQNLVKRGARVVIGDIQLSGAAEVDRMNKKAEGHVAIFQHCNVSDTNALWSLIDLAITAFGQLDILVNNAGILDKPWELDPTGSTARRCITTNICGTIEATNYALHHWNQQKDAKGVVVNLASMAAYVPLNFMATYAATKAAIVMYTKCMASVAPKVRVNAIAPGGVDTKFIDAEHLGRDHWTVKASGLIQPQRVVDQVMRAIEDESLAGDIIIVKNNEEPELCKLPKSTDMEALFQTSSASV